MSSIDTNIPEIERYISDLTDYYETTMPSGLTKLAAEVLQDLKAGKFKNDTGALRRSMRTKAFEYGIEINMLDYGYFLSFGVRGGKYKALGLTNAVAAVFGVQKGYKFTSRKHRKWGIEARDFYPMNLEDKLIELLTKS